MISAEPPNKRRRKQSQMPPLLLQDSHHSDGFIDLSESAIVPELPVTVDVSAPSHVITASEIMSSSNKSTSVSTNNNIKWWKRVIASRTKQPSTRSHGNKKERLEFDREMFVRSILESCVSSVSSQSRYSVTGNSNLVTDTKCSIQSMKKRTRACRNDNDKGQTQQYNKTNTGKMVMAADFGRTTGPDKRDVADLPAYVAHSTPNGDPEQDKHCVEMGGQNHLHRSAGVLGHSSNSSHGLSHDEMDDGVSAPSSVSDDEDRNKRRLQRCIEMRAMRARLLEKNQHQVRARKKMYIFIAFIGVTLTAFVAAAIFIARVGVEIRNNALDSRTSTTRSNTGSVIASSGSIGLDADLSFLDSSAINDDASVSSNTYTYIHCVLMVLSLWMSLVVVIMHLTFQNFRTYSHPFVLELNCAQCGYWITSLLRVMLETAAMSNVAYLFFCMLECFFNFAQISFTCAIAFNMYRSVVSYADMLLDSHSAKRRYCRYTMNVLLFSVMAAVVLALVGYRFDDMSDNSKDNEDMPLASLPETEEKILDEEIFAPCLYPTCRLILYVYYPMLAFGFNFIFYVRFKRTIGKSYPTSATGRLNKVARSYLTVFFVCWGSLISLTLSKLVGVENVPIIVSFVMQSVFDISSVCTAVITFMNFRRCRKAFDFGFSLKAIDPSSIEFDDPVNIVGEGTFAIVLKATWRQGEHREGSASRSVEVAVKTFKQAQMECLEHIKEEAYLSSKLVHPCVMMTYGCYTSGINFYIVYEYLGGGTLQDVIDANQSTSFSYERGLRYAHMIAVGMRFLHGLPVPIVHRDLKPLNCIFDSEQEMLKVADFGESRLLRARDVMARRPSSFPSADVTVQMTTNIGSACWAAPEVLKEEATSEYSVKIDVYSFGIICWQLYTCAVPYADIPGSVLAVAEAVLSGVRPAIPHDCPRVFTKIMERCWHDNPLRRPSFEVIVQLLEIELTEERRRQLMHPHDRSNESVMTPPILGTRGCDETGCVQSMDVIER